MANETGNATGGTASFLTEEDVMSLAEAQQNVTDDSVPDTLEVRSDAVAVMQGAMQPMRRPAVKVAVVVGIVLAVVVAGGILGRIMRPAQTPSSLSP